MGKNSVTFSEWEDLECHPYCSMFPAMNEDEYENLVADIKANGLHEPIKLIEVKEDSYQILDGRNRHSACLDAGVEPLFDFFDGKDALIYAVGQNVSRRHLSTGQLAALADKVADMKVGDNQKSKKDGISREKAAAMFNTTEKAVQRFRQVKDADANLARQVEEGIETLNGALSQIGKPTTKPKANPVPKDDKPLFYWDNEADVDEDEPKKKPEPIKSKRAPEFHPTLVKLSEKQLNKLNLGKQVEIKVNGESVFIQAEEF